MQVHCLCMVMEAHSLCACNKLKVKCRTEIAVVPNTTGSALMSLPSYQQLLVCDVQGCGL